MHYLISSNTVYFLASFHKLSGSDNGICFNVINMVVNQKEADVYPQNVPYTFSAPIHWDYFLSKLSAFKNLSEVTTPEANK